MMPSFEINFDIISDDEITYNLDETVKEIAKILQITVEDIVTVNRCKGGMHSYHFIAPKHCIQRNQMNLICNKLGNMNTTTDLQLFMYLETSPYKNEGKMRITSS